MSTLSESVATAIGLVAAGDAALVRTVVLSFAVSGTACFCAAWLGLLGGAWLAVAHFRGHRLVLIGLDTLLALPSVVAGLAVYLLLSRSGPLGSWGLLFTPTAMVFVQTILALPIITALARQVVADALREGGDQLRSMGARPLLGALLMLLHERWAVLTLLLIAFGRAIA
ncbi:MAG: ABC transporter permease, partial [Pseudomonadota bacterium]|nr:ABC transporter permease [Pseudomonadota bacterium]